jgi:hypothetical protein
LFGSCSQNLFHGISVGICLSVIRYCQITKKNEKNKVIPKAAPRIFPYHPQQQSPNLKHQPSNEAQNKQQFPIFPSPDRQAYPPQN